MGLASQDKNWRFNLSRLLEEIFISIRGTWSVSFRNCQGRKSSKK